MRVTHQICTELSDLEIIQHSLKEVDYFSCLYDRYEDRLLRYIKRMASVTNEEAEDILQEAFIKIWKNLNAFDQTMKLSSWLYRIVHNQAISTLRKKKSFGKDHQEVFDEISFKTLTDPPDNERDVQEAKEKCTHMILAELPLRYREVMVLRFLENMSYEEISDVLKIPEGTVATRINRAKKAFRKRAVNCPPLRKLVAENHKV